MFSGSCDTNGSVYSDSETMDNLDEEYIQPRILKLGFTPQKEVPFNNLLPYSDTLDDQSQSMLNDIKGNLGRCVMMKEIDPGALLWTQNLQRYIQIFGLKFSKEDHITFIKVIFEVITVPNLEPASIHKLAVCLTFLLKKKELIPRKDLVLPWRPLFEIFDHLMCRSNSTLGMYRFSPNVETSLSALLSVARVYFDPAVTQDMLDLWRPQLCPFDSTTIQGTVELLDSFLPTIFLPGESDLGYKLWFGEFMDFWKTCHNSPNWESSMMSLMSRLASQNIGEIDWEPHMALMYTRILRSFSLPVNYKKMKINKNHKLGTSAFTIWIVATLGGGSSSQAYLSRMMKVLESYFHPANNGAWVIRLKEFLRKLPFYFIRRLNHERNQKSSWLPVIRESARLTEEDITRFVKSMAPTVGLAMYSGVAMEVSLSLQYLAIMRPSIVIPPIIESMYNTLTSLTEPHKYTAAMLSLVSVARPMIEPNDYKEGPTHVIPLLMAILPGIDPNDIRKCFITFQLITTFITMIPVVDASKASEHWKDLTEEEEVLCAATSQWEDFVLEFLDRCFTLVDNSVLESTRLEQADQSRQLRSRMENVAENAIVSAFTTLLCQTSPQIFKSALHKLQTFVTSRIFETTVSGKCVASICRTFAKVRPEETLKLLLPHFCEMIFSIAEHEDLKQEDKLDNELLYNMLLLSELVNCNGKAVSVYGEMIERVLDLTLHLKCVEGYTIACKILGNILHNLAATRPQEYRSSNEDYSKPVSEYLSIREWGRPYHCHEVKMKWNTPGGAQVTYAQHLIDKYLPSELDALQGYAAGTRTLTREEVLCSLSVIASCLNCGRLLPLWDEPVCSFVDSTAERKNFIVEAVFSDKVTMPNGNNVRKAIASVMSELQTKLLTSAEDDIKSLNRISFIWNCLLLNMMPSCDEFEAQMKNLLLGKKLFENKLLGKKRHIRSILINQAYHQHEGIVLSSCILPTETHKEIFGYLFELATSHYSEVRKNAQGRINSALRIFRDEMLLVPHIVNALKHDSNLHHEKFKGALYVLLGPKDGALIARHKWHVVRELWPAIVKAQPSEKPSVINLLNACSDLVFKQFPTIGMQLEIGDKGEKEARSLWTGTGPALKLALPSTEEMATGLKLLEKRSERNKAEYLQLLNSLLSCIHSNLHWRYHSLALGFIRDLVHPDCDYPPEVIRNILQTLIHDNIEFRKIAIRCTVYVLKQQKRAHKYRSVAVDRSCGPAAYGDREDNQWLQYCKATAPQTAEAWDQPRYAHKLYTGYYSWSKVVEVASPASEQPPLDRLEKTLTPGEREVHNFFSDPHKLDRLIAFLSLEGKKGKDKFDGMKFILFKNLFRNTGDTYVELFKPHLERLIADKQESNQRCAAEIITGMIRGSKHWPYEKVKKMWNYLIPLLKTAFTNMTVETVHDWSVLAATSSEHRDPNRHHWFLEFLMDDPLREDASFIDCGRLMALQGALNVQEWRVSELFIRLLEYLRPKLSHPYQLLRERLGSLLTNIFSPDLPTNGRRRTRGPHIGEFVKSIMPQLQCLYSLSVASSNQPAINGTTSGCQMEVQLPEEKVQMDDEEKNTAICLLKTMVKWVTNSVVRANFSAIPEFFAFLPLVCLMESYEADDELNKICSAMLAAMAQSLTLVEFMPVSLAAIQEVSEMSSWWARASCLEFLQVFVFHNMATITSQDSWASQVNSLVLRLLKDERLEVREKAGQVLSGLIHCNFVADRRQLMNELRRLASKQKKSATNEMSKRHAGVLGLCAFISANPYDVVDPVPEIFLLLGLHLNDPQPIPTSIRKTLGDFKRTHHDNWEQHKLKFTEEQLAVLSDLSVPPSHYA